VFDLHVDHLGSTRLVTDDSGAVTSRHDYMPFGDEISQGISYNTHAFTGHERDKATGLDYMLARYYSGSLARFLSFDPGHTSAQSNIPSSWNRFAYVTNQPIVMTDPDGEAGVYMRWINTPLWEWWPRTFPQIQGYVFTQHWQIFYSDGTNIGLFSNGVWEEDRASPSIQATYRPLLEGLDDSVMEAALRMTMPRFSLAYDNPCDNCQDAVLAALENYNVVAKKRGVMPIDAETLENLRQNTLCEMVKVVAPIFAPDPVRYTPNGPALNIPLGGTNFEPGSMNRMKVMVNGVGLISMGD
jgi:RHS repeat-associated protein